MLRVHWEARAVEGERNLNAPKLAPIIKRRASTELLAKFVTGSGGVTHAKFIKKHVVVENIRTVLVRVGNHKSQIKTSEEVR